MFDINKYYNPNRRIEPKVPRDWKKKYVDLCISELPGPAAVNRDDIEPGAICAFEYANDNFIVKDVSDTRKMELYWAWGFVGAFIFVLSVLLIGGRKFDSGFLLISLFTGLFTILPALWSFYKAYFINKERKLIFDRQRGLVQVPGSLNEPPQLMRFEDLHVVVALATRFQGGIYLRLFKNKSLADKLEGGVLFSFAYGTYLQSWSYFVWYMDRNRPLPPGDALDPYRQRDYERRKAEGFPPPLYPSAFETPEHFTKEFQLLNERNKMVPGRYNISLNNEQKIEIAPVKTDYYNT